MVSDARGILVAVGRWWLMKLQEVVDVGVDLDVEGGDDDYEDVGGGGCAQPEQRGGRRNRYL